jgi:hypothetical protein
MYVHFFQLNIPVNDSQYPSPHVGAEFDLSEYKFTDIDTHALMVIIKINKWNYVIFL